MFTFADSFDLYATTADPIAGYWDSGVGISGGNVSLPPGRFTGGQAFRCSNSFTNLLTKSSSVNDAVHHIVCAVRHNSALTGTFAGLFFTLFDGATAQCSVVFRTDGALLLTTGGPTGATLATYTGAVSSQTTWLAFEIEVVVNNTTGSFTVRKNGNTSNDFTLGSLNTRGGTANSYANKLTVGMQNIPAISTDLDDLLWRSDPTSVAWMGDIRCYTRMPASDASVQFARSLSAFAQPQSAAGGSTLVRSGNGGLMSAFTAAYSGTIASGTVGVNTGGTGNMKAAIYDSTRTIVLATSNAVVNPAAGNVAITFATPLTVTKGVTYHLAVDQDFIVSYNSTASTQWQFTTPYASFPTANPALLGGNQGVAFILNIATTLNADFVNETLQDGTASYVYDATVGHGDLYTIGAASPAPTSVVAVTTRGFIEKSDAGSRSGAVQLRSGAFVTSTTWNPSDQANTTFSGGNLTATFAGTPTNAGVRSIYSAATGKYYYEARFNSPSNNVIGLGLASANLTTLFSTAGAGCTIWNGQFVYVNGSLVVNMGTNANNGDIVCIAVDLAAKLVWFRLNAGNWNNNATYNPATGVGGFDITSISTGALYAICGGAPTAGFTANFGGSAFAQTVPSGFLAGFGSGGVGTTVQSTSTPLSSNFAWLYRTDVTDPNTGSAWTPAAVDGLQIGPVVTA